MSILSAPLFIDLMSALSMFLIAALQLRIDNSNRRIAIPMIVGGVIEAVLCLCLLNHVLIPASVWLTCRKAAALIVDLLAVLSFTLLLSVRRRTNQTVRGAREA